MDITQVMDITQETQNTIWNNPRFKGAYYGVELEIEAEGLYAIEESYNEETEEYEQHDVILPPGWDLREEHSIQGCEVVTYPMQYEQAIIAITELFEDVRGRGFSPIRTPRGSTHVHVNCQDKTWEQLESFMFACAWAEPFLCEIAGRGRIGNLFAMPYSASPLAWEGIVRSLKHKQFIFHEDTHYSAVNFYPLSVIGTVEFRMGASARSADEAIDWLSLIHTLNKEATENCVTAGNPTKFVLDVLSLMPPSRGDKCMRQARQAVEELTVRLNNNRQPVATSPTDTISIAQYPYPFPPIDISNVWTADELTNFVNQNFTFSAIT